MRTQTKPNERRAPPDLDPAVPRGLAMQAAVKGGRLSANHAQATGSAMRTALTGGRRARNHTQNGRRRT